MKDGLENNEIPLGKVTYHGISNKMIKQGSADCFQHSCSDENKLNIFQSFTDLDIKKTSISAEDGVANNWDLVGRHC